MKFIHTADWHLGNSMHDIDRQKETEQFLAWLKERIVELGAQCLVIAGDIFDTTTPPIEARRQYFRFLASLLETDCKNIVLIGGNHDSGALLDAPRDLLEALNIQMVGSLGERPVEELVKELTDASGNVVGISAAVPYVRETELRRFKPEDATDFAQSTYSGLYSAVYEAAEKLRASRFFLPASSNMGQLCIAKLDLEMHMNYDEKFKGKNLDEASRELLQNWQSPTTVPGKSIMRRLRHCITGGYSAGYYSYKWAEVLAADAYSRFRNEGVLNRKTGSDFRDFILSQGDSRPAADLYRQFMGRDPNPDALLQIQGLCK